MKKLLLSFVMIFGAILLFAQPVIKFDQTTIDFGTIKEEDGKASGKFEFTNTGNEDLMLTSVKPGCGCTAAEYTKTPVPPGERGYIIATYNPYNRPGSFNKNIRVTTNESKFKEDDNAPAHVIYIKGTVEKRPPSKYDIAGYTNGNGDVRIKENNVKLDLLNTESKSFTIKVMNFSDKLSTFEPINLPEYITIEKSPILLSPDTETDVTFIYDATKRNEIGAYKDVVSIQTQDSIEPKISFFIELNVKEDFSKLTPKQLLDAPKAVLDSLNLDFGKVAKNINPTQQITIYNKGKNPLIIRQLKSSNTIFSVNTNLYEIPKDGSANLSVTLTSRNRRGIQTATIEIVTNDPENSTIILNCRGDISQ